MKSCVILVNKPRGLTSNKVVNIVKYFVDAKKAGHLGTLDKLGEGLLPVTINGATRLFEEFLSKDKEYITTFKFGEETPSFDLETEIMKRDDVDVSLQALQSVLPKFIGEFDQIPPKYSAKNINGKRAYTLVQQNEEFEIKPKRVTIYSIEILQKVEKNTYKLKVHCSSGTYIRSLCRDIAYELSTCGVMYDITRTKCGVFDIKDSFNLPDIEKGNFEVVSLDNMFNYPIIEVSSCEKDRILQGVKLSRKEQDGDYRVYSNNELFGIGYIKNQELRMKIKI